VGLERRGLPPDLDARGYNVVAAPKQLLLAAETGHNTVPEETAKVDRWIDGQAGR